MVAREILNAALNLSVQERFEIANALLAEDDLDRVVKSMRRFSIEMGKYLKSIAVSQPTFESLKRHIIRRRDMLGDDLGQDAASEKQVILRGTVIICAEKVDAQQ